MKAQVFFLLTAIIVNTFAWQGANYELKQVVILSRHNVRTPLAKDLAEMTPKPWPKWKEKSGYLTEKGAMLEGFMGEFFYAWLNEIGLLPSHCPDEGDFYVYANSKQRTKASANAFVKRAFPNCNVTVHYSNSTDKMDPVFNPVLHNNSAIFKKMALEEMELILKSLHMNSSYEYIQNILDYGDSKICMTTKQCDLAKGNNRIGGVNPGFKPYILGPLKIAKSSIDAFIMENYQGFPERAVAWGEIPNSKKWYELMELSRGYHNIIFNTTLIAKDISRPLIKYITKLVMCERPKATLLMGHDANMYTLMKTLNFKPYSLQRQYEVTPAGGKIVFQRWFDTVKEEDFLKIEYVYSTVDQMRKGIKLSLENPPQFTLLELEGCKIDSEGYCPWSNFVNILNNI